jgi:hypothetical protein
MGILYLVGDSTLKGKREPKHPVAQKTHLSRHHPYVFGFRVVLLITQWDTYRIPVDFALVRRVKDYRKRATLDGRKIPTPWL